MDKISKEETERSYMFENRRLKRRIIELENINEQHRKLNGELREQLKTEYQRGYDASNNYWNP